jgi:hypothetical protein
MGMLGNFFAAIRDFLEFFGSEELDREHKPFEPLTPVRPPSDHETNEAA